KVVHLHVDSGSEAETYAAEQQDKKLRPLYNEMISLEKKTESLLNELEQMRKNEEKMRDINESTNARVAWFSTISLVSLVGVAGWQVWYLRKFFQTKCTKPFLLVAAPGL
ncbi:vesicle coat component, partial [Cladochytrium tenue]